MNIKTIIRESIVRILSEEIYGKTAIVYHGSSLDMGEIAPFFEQGLFQPGLGAGSMYGPGLYTVFQLRGSNTEKGAYGDFIYKIKLNVDGFVCFNEYTSIKVYGSSLTIREQLEKSGNKKAISFVENNTNSKLVDYLDKPLKEIESKEFGAQASSKERYGFEISRTAPVAYEFTSADFWKYVPGILYVGNNDGLCALVYDANAAVLVAGQKIGHKNWTKASKEDLRRNVGRVFQKGSARELIKGDDRTKAEKLSDFFQSDRFLNLSPEIKKRLKLDQFNNAKESAQALVDSNAYMEEKIKFWYLISKDLFYNVNAFLYNDLFELLNILFPENEQFPSELSYTFSRYIKDAKDMNLYKGFIDFISKRKFEGYIRGKQGLKNNIISVESLINEIFHGIIGKAGEGSKYSRVPEVRKNLEYFSSAFKENSLLSSDTKSLVSDNPYVVRPSPYSKSIKQWDYKPESFLLDLIETSSNFEEFTSVIKNNNFHKAITRYFTDIVGNYKYGTVAEKMFGNIELTFTSAKEGAFLKGESKPYKALYFLDRFFSPKELASAFRGEGSFGLTKDFIDHLGSQAIKSYEEKSVDQKETLNARMIFSKPFFEGLDVEESIDFGDVAPGIRNAAKVILKMPDENDEFYPGLLASLKEKALYSYESDPLKCLDYIFTIFVLTDDKSIPTVLIDPQGNSGSRGTMNAKRLAEFINNNFIDVSRIISENMGLLTSLINNPLKYKADLPPREAKKLKVNLIKKINKLITYLENWSVPFRWWDASNLKDGNNVLRNSNILIYKSVENMTNRAVIKEIILDRKSDKRLLYEKILIDSLRVNTSLDFKALQEMLMYENNGRFFFEASITGDNFDSNNLHKFCELMFDKLNVQTDQIGGMNFLGKENIDFIISLLTYAIKAPSAKKANFNTYIDDVVHYLLALYHTFKVDTKKLPIGFKICQLIESVVQYRGVSREEVFDMYNKIIENIHDYPKIKSYIIENDIVLFQHSTKAKGPNTPLSTKDTI